MHDGISITYVYLAAPQHSTRGHAKPCVPAARGTRAGTQVQVRRLMRARDRARSPPALAARRRGGAQGVELPLSGELDVRRKLILARGQVFPADKQCEHRCA